MKIPHYSPISEHAEASGIERDCIRRAIIRGELGYIQPGGVGGTMYIEDGEFAAWVVALRQVKRPVKAEATRRDEPPLEDVEWSSVVLA